MKQLTQRQAWLLLAEACDKAKFYSWWRSRYFFVVDPTQEIPECHGLCHGINDLRQSGQISDSVADIMISRIDEHKPMEYTSPGFHWGHTKASMKARARFCRRQAAKCGRKERVTK